jgi:hypothetical protein
MKEKSIHTEKKQCPVPTLARYIFPVMIKATVLLSLVACGRPASPAPTASVTATALLVVTLETRLGETIPPLLTPTQPPSLAPLDQYRVWMEEARLQYPYPESVEVMWAVMLCESEGNVNAVGTRYYGLFQYSPETWAGEWNPYRAYPIFDPYAQIFATAKAWSDGYQLWWCGCLPEP